MPDRSTPERSEAWLRRDKERHARKRKTAAQKVKDWLDRVAFQKLLVARRRRQIQALRAPRGAKAAVEWALDQVGTTESPYGSNWGPKISDWIKDTGYTFAVPWCQCFANAAAVKGGCPQLKTGYTPAVLNGEGDYKPVSEANAEPGDFVFFKFPGVSGDTCDHVGVLTRAPRVTAYVVESVEGNTDSSSQNNGGRVEARTRSKSLVAGYVHPPYKKG